jgi:hypothetical protein
LVRMSFLSSFNCSKTTCNIESILNPTFDTSLTFIVLTKDYHLITRSNLWSVISLSCLPILHTAVSPSVFLLHYSTHLLQAHNGTQLSCCLPPCVLRPQYNFQVSLWSSMQICIKNV